MKKTVFIILAVLLVLAFPFAAHAQIAKDQYYARSTLDGNELAFYDHVYSEIEEGKETVYPDEYGLSDDIGLKLVHYVRNDSPELIRRESIYTDAEAAELIAEVDVKSNGIIADVIAPNMTDYEKAEAVYYWVAENTKYGTSRDAGDDGQTIIGALLFGKATCAGLSRTIQYMLYKLDIPCYVVTGGSHAWNMIQVDGEWYNADITADQMIIKNGVNDLAFFLWDDSFYNDHEAPSADENPELPACTNDKYMVEPEPTPTPTPEPTPTPTATPAPVVADVEPQEPPGGTGDGSGWLAMMIPAVIIIVVVAVRGRKEKRT